jgi:hypothetical protein
VSAVCAHERPRLLSPFAILQAAPVQLATSRVLYLRLESLTIAALQCPSFFWLTIVKLPIVELSQACWPFHISLC